MLGSLVALACLTGMVWGSAAQAQPYLAEGPRSLVIEYHSEAKDRPAFRAYLIHTMAPRLRGLQTNGTLSSFRILFSWYAQPEVWDALVELQFPESRSLARWNALETQQPGGLDTEGLSLAEPILTVSADVAFASGDTDAVDGAVYYIVPYSFGGAAEYLAYAKGYVIPQYEGWMRDGSLAGYQVLVNRYPVGPPWDSLAILEYRDLASFGRRQVVLDEVRKGLSNDPTWRDYHARKASLRSETENSIAELIAH